MGEPWQWEEKGEGYHLLLQLQDRQFSLDQSVELSCSFSSTQWDGSSFSELFPRLTPLWPEEPPPLQIERMERTHEQREGEERWQITYQITANRVGSHALIFDQLQLPSLSSKEENRSLALPTLSLEVLPLREPLPPLSLPGLWKEHSLGATLAIDHRSSSSPLLSSSSAAKTSSSFLAWLTVPLFLFLWYLLKEKKISKKREERREESTLPEERAERALCQIREKGWLEREEYEAFYLSLTEVVRCYLEEKYQLHAPEQTTEEFLQELTERGEFGFLRELLCNFLSHADLVKFARENSSLSHCSQAEAAALRLIGVGGKE